MKEKMIHLWKKRDRLCNGSLDFFETNAMKSKIVEMLRDMRSDEPALTGREIQEEFQAHKSAFVMVNIGLVSVYLLTGLGGYPWFLWVLFSWGLGLYMHYRHVKSMGQTIIDEVEVERLKVQQ